MSTYVSEKEKARKSRKPKFEWTKDGKLIVNDLPASNPTFVTLGMFILWFGWYGFNCGSVITIMGHWNVAGRVALNMTIAPCVASMHILLI